MSYLICACVCGTMYMLLSPPQAPDLRRVLQPHGACSEHAEPAPCQPGGLQAESRGNRASQYPGVAQLAAQAHTSFPQHPSLALFPPPTLFGDFQNTWTKLEHNLSLTGCGGLDKSVSMSDT